MIISRTPFRVSFFGGGADFPGFYRQHGGATLLTAIDKYCYISLHELSPFFKHRFRASYARTETVQTPAEFQHPLIRESLLEFPPDRGLEISHVSDLPGRTGLGTSSSFTVGLLHALHAFMGRRVTAEDLARQSIHIERVRVGDAGGHQDQYAAAYGGLLKLEFGPGDAIGVHRVPLTNDRLVALEESLLLLYTGIESSAAHTLDEQTRRIDDNTPTLQRLAAMVQEAERILVDDGDLDGFGDLLHEGWMLKRSLSNGISNPMIDRAYETARAHGARGGKLLGAGGRGFLLLYAPPHTHPAIREALPELQPVPFRFSLEGSRIIFQSV